MKRIRMIEDDRLSEDEPLYAGNIYNLMDGIANSLIAKGKAEEYHGPA